MEPVVHDPHWPVGNPPYHWEYIWGQWALVSAGPAPATVWGPLLGRVSSPPSPMKPTESEPEPEPVPA